MDRQKLMDTIKDGLLVSDYCTEQAVSALEKGDAECAIASALISIAHSLTAIGMMKVGEE